MYRTFPSALAAMTACCLAAGCNTTASPIAAPQIANVSGDYSGSMQDTGNGNGNATGSLAQHGASAGGGITATETGGTVTAQFSISVNSANAVSGAIVVDYPPAGTGPVCTYSTSGTFDPSTSVLSGTFTAVSNCSGDTGSYTLTQLCHDQITGGEVRELGNPKC